MTTTMISDDGIKLKQALTEILEAGGYVFEGASHDGAKGTLYRLVLEAIEKPLIEQVLEQVDGNQLKAAKILGINRNTMRAKIRKLGISPDKYR
ncbi:MAG: hypothetical protein KJ880_04140 [Candidatus Omnitrophica bacterium]|nr:hypothetical protein [Candidatus Omnitrophota bacterium]MBU1870424.1 hypothetical protein [Candidatus Omnitrophota bacterium]